MTAHSRGSDWLQHTVTIPVCLAVGAAGSYQRDALRYMESPPRLDRPATPWRTRFSLSLLFSPALLFSLIFPVFFCLASSFHYLFILFAPERSSRPSFPGAPLSSSTHWARYDGCFDIYLIYILFFPCLAYHFELIAYNAPCSPARLGCCLCPSIAAERRAVARGAMADGCTSPGQPSPTPAQQR